MKAVSASRVLILVAVICFVLATFGFNPLDVSLVAAGLAFWAAGSLVG